MYFSVLDSKGLYSYANPLGQQAVPGSMSSAINVNCDEIGITTTRRGFDFYSSQQFDVSGGFVIKLFVYKNILYTSFGGGKFAQDNGSGTWTIYPSFTMLPPVGGFLHQMLAGGNSYFTTSNGIYKLSGTNSNAPIPAGAPAALDTMTLTSGMIASGFLNAQSQVGYEIVWGYTDESNLLILGAPSFAVVASNTQVAGPNNNANVTVTFSIPPFVEQHQSLPWFYQIYRTPNTGSLLVPPGNNYQLVIQDNPKAGDYTNHFVSFVDTVLDEFLGASLYTADGQPDVGNPFGQPPLAQDIAYFSNMAFYANFSTLQNVFLTLDSVGAPLGLQVGDTISITDSTSATTYTYTGGGANVPATRTFKIDTSGTPSFNIQATAQNLVSVINQDPNNTLFIIQYTSDFGALPGQMQIFAQNLSQDFFSVVSSRTTSWTPALPSSGITYASSNAEVPNGIFISEIDKPESVPPAFILNVGSPNFPIERIIAVRTALIVVKPEEGVFEITGSSPTTLNVTTLDTTAFINGSETMAPLNNSGYFFTTQGVMLVNESGCEIMSRNIQGELLTLASFQFPSFPALAFGLGYQSDNAYILFLQQNPTDTFSNLQYRYNWITQAWTTWNIPSTAAVVNTANDTLYLATPQGFILKERKTFTALDYADQSTAITINSILGNKFTLASSVNVQVGDQISQTVGPSTFMAFVLDNDLATNTITVDDPTSFSTGAASDIAAINSTISFMPTSCGYPAFIKKFTTWNFEFSNIAFNKCTVFFNTDFSPNPESVILTPALSGQWGTFQWGTNPWGAGQLKLQPVSTYSTKNTSIGHWTNVTLNLRQAFNGFALCGYSIFFNFLGERSR